MIDLGDGLGADHPVRRQAKDDLRQLCGNLPPGIHAEVEQALRDGLVLDLVAAQAVPELVLVEGPDQRDGRDLAAVDVGPAGPVRIGLSGNAGVGRSAAVILDVRELVSTFVEHDVFKCGEEVSHADHQKKNPAEAGSEGVPIVSAKVQSPRTHGG